MRRDADEGSWSPFTSDNPGTATMQAITDSITDWISRNTCTARLRDTAKDDDTEGQPPRSKYVLPGALADVELQKSEGPQKT